MSPSFSVYLDLVRFLAALAVVFDHLSIFPITDGILPKRLGSYSAIAVTVFFVLSGYVIAYVISRRERTLTEYSISRIARIYSVILIALAFTWVLDNIGMTLNPAFYKFQRILWKPESISGYLASALFVNEYQIFDFGGIAPGTNAPFWSLSFEVTYYVVAGACVFLPRRASVILSVAILCLAGRTILALLPVWWLGYAAFVKREQVQFSRRVALMIFICSSILFLALPAITYRLPGNNLGVTFPHGRGPFNRNLLQDYIAAVVFTANMLAARALMPAQVSVPRIVGKVLHWLGSLTFPLYCLHFPLLCFAAAISPWSKQSLIHLLFIGVSTFLVVAAVTPLCDAMKLKIRRLLRSPALRPKTNQ